MKSGAFASRHRSAIEMFVALAAVGSAAAIALWLRWLYILSHGPNVDELTTLYAATQVLADGVPIMPSGVLYTRGILSTYATALSVAVGGLSYTVARLPSILFGLAALLAIFWIGRKEWNGRVGWLALIGLAFLPEAMVWGGRIRFYSQLLFFVLITLWAAFAAIRVNEEPGPGKSALRLHLLFAAAFWLALFSQEETVLLYPSLVLAMVLWRGVRYLLQPAPLIGQVLCLSGLVLRFAIEQVGQPGYFGAMQVDKPYIGLFFDVSGGWAVYRDLLIHLPRLPGTVVGLVAVAAALLALHHHRWRMDHLAVYHQATLFFTLQYLAVLVLMLTIVGPDWQGKRYLLMMQPCWLLVGAAGAVWIVDRVSARPAVRWSAVAVLTLLIPLFASPEVSDILRPPYPAGYAEVFEQVAARLQPGDLVMSPQPAACAVVLKRPCDYFVRQANYEAYVIPRNGVLADRWSGSPLLNTTSQLESAIRAAPRVWFIVDGDRLGNRYDDDFVHTVVDQFRSVLDVGEVKALLAQGWQEQSVYVAGKRFDPPAKMGPLALAAWERTQPAPETYLDVRLEWEMLETTQALINTSVQLVAPDGSRLSQADGTPAEGLVSLDEYARALLPDHKVLRMPAELPAGRYRLEAIAYDVVTHDPVAPALAFDWPLIGDGPAAPDHRLDLSWQSRISLVGHDELPAELQANTPLPVRLVWTTHAPVDDTPALFETPSVFIHLVGPDGAIATQSDHALGGDFYPAARWETGDRVEDLHSLTLPASLPAGEYRLIAGLYDPATGQRLAMTDGSTTLELRRWLQP